MVWVYVCEDGSRCSNIGGDERITRGVAALWNSMTSSDVLFLLSPTGYASVRSLGKKGFSRVRPAKTDRGSQQCVLNGQTHPFFRTGSFLGSPFTVITNGTQWRGNKIPDSIEQVGSYIGIIVPQCVFISYSGQVARAGMIYLHSYLRCRRWSDYDYSSHLKESNLWKRNSGWRCSTGTKGCSIKIDRFPIWIYFGKFKDSRNQKECKKMNFFRQCETNTIAADTYGMRLLRSSGSKSRRENSHHRRIPKHAFHREPY